MNNNFNPNPNNIDFNNLVLRLPPLELSYENIIHKKVHSDIYLLIPNGIRALAWITYYKNTNLCLILQLDKNNIIKKIESTLLCFDKSLSYGTLIYGTYFNINQQKCFTCEDILYYKNVFVHNLNFIKRLNLLKNIFKNEINQNCYTNKFTLFALPIISNNYNDIINSIPDINYNIKGIKFINFYSKKDIGIQLIKQKRNVECVFLIKPQIKFDIYDIYCWDHKENAIENYGIASIPNYKTSVMMNNLYRKIKENKNLDLLEESDSEEEFENNNIDKFVHLNKSFYFKCVFLKKFRKWKPIECVESSKLLSKNEILKLEKYS